MEFFEPIYESFNYITSIVEDNTGGVWVSSYNYICRYDGKSWAVYDVRYIFNVTQTNILVNSIAIDNQNVIWVATDRGIMRFDGTNWKIYTTADGLTYNYVAGFSQDKTGNIWAYGFYSGLNLFEGNSWQSFLKDDRIDDISNDNNGNMWLATDHGVIKYDGNTLFRVTRLPMVYWTIMFVQSPLIIIMCGAARTTV